MISPYLRIGRTPASSVEGSRDEFETAVVWLSPAVTVRHAPGRASQAAVEKFGPRPRRAPRPARRLHRRRRDATAGAGTLPLTAPSAHTTPLHKRPRGAPPT